MSSLIEFRNLTFNGDQVTFDIHIPLPPGAAQWEGFVLYGTFNGMDPSYFTMHSIDGQTLINNSNNGQIEMFNLGSLASGGTVATFSGPASVFTDSSGLGSGLNPDSWDIGDLFSDYQENGYGISNGEIYAYSGNGDSFSVYVASENIITFDGVEKVQVDLSIPILVTAMVEAVG